MTAFTCAQVHELAPDLVLGMLTGEERARMLEHLAGCADCEEQVTDLSAVVDRLLLLAPEVDPPAGFENRVLARIAGPPQRRRWYTRPLSIAAAVVLVCGAAGGAGVVWAHHTHSGLDREYVDAVAALGGKDIRAATLVGASNRPWGQAFVFDGNPSWVFVSMRWDLPNGTYSLVLDRNDGQPSMIVPGLRMVDGQGSMGHTVYDTAAITKVHVVDASGKTICTALLAT